MRNPHETWSGKGSAGSATSVHSAKKGASRGRVPVLSTTELTIILNATIIEETKVSSEFLLAGNYRVIKNSNRKFE